MGADESLNFNERHHTRPLLRDREKQDMSGLKAICHTVHGVPLRINEFRIIDSTLTVVYTCRATGLFNPVSRIYRADDAKSAVLLVQQRSTYLIRVHFDVPTGFDVIDGITLEKIGAFGAASKKGSLPERWLIVDHLNQPVGSAEVCRFMALGVSPRNRPDRVVGLIGERQVFELKVKTWRWFEMKADFSMDIRGALDPRMRLAAAVHFAGRLRVPD